MLGTAVAVAVAAIVGSGAPVLAADEATIDVVAGVNGYHEPGDHVLLRISVTSERLVEGSIVATTGFDQLTTQAPIQVAAGATKRVDIVVPTHMWEQGATGVQLVDGDGEVLAEARVTLRADPAVELVGVLPGVARRAGELPEQETLATAGRAEIAELPVDALPLGRGVLDVYDTVVGLGDDLRRLGEADRAALLAWVDSGGRLLLDDDDLTALPEAWRPGPARYAWAGRGEIRLVDGAATAGRWADIIEPSPIEATDHLNMGSELVGDPQQDLAVRAGVRLPTLSPVIIGLIAYALVVGPGTYLILRRMRRLTLAWVAVPLLAVATAGGVVAAGGRYRSSGDPVAAMFVEGSPAGASAYASVLTFSRSGGTATITAPRGWQLDQSDAWGGVVPIDRSTTLGADGTRRLDVRLEAGQVTVGAFSGPTAAHELTTTARLTPEGDIEGTVVNGTTMRLRDVAVFAGADAVLLGALDPGQQAPWTLDAPRAIVPTWGRGSQVWGLDGMAGMEGDVVVDARPAGGMIAVAEPGGQPPVRGRSELAEIGIWGMTASRRELFPTGFARVAGWTDELQSGIELGGLDSTRTVLSSMTAIDPNGSPPNLATIRATVVRSPFGPLGDGAGSHQMYRYLLPPGIDPGALVLRGPGGQELVDVEFWSDDGWVEVGNDVAEAAVPDAAIRDGVVLARAATTNLGDPSLVPTLDAAGAP